MEIMERFFDKVDIPPDDGCWLWKGPYFQKGYGQFSVGRQSPKRAHRVSYEWFTGTTIPTGMVTDHLCKIRNCVRPDHLRIVTPRQNVLENSVGLTAQNHRKTHCQNGHPLHGDHVYINPYGQRICNICKRQWRKEYRAAALSRWLKGE